MTENELPETRGLNRRSVLRNGLLGLGFTAAGLASPFLTGTASATSLQDSWRWCSNCQGLFYGPQQSSSACPDAAHHVIGSGSFNYILMYNVTGGGADPQPGWLWCQYCKAIFYGGRFTFGGVCPIDFRRAHDGGTRSDGTTVSFHYSMLYNSPDQGQSNWLWCKNCQVLFYNKDNVGFAGSCPATDSPHDGTASYDYDVPH